MNEQQSHTERDRFLPSQLPNHELLPETQLPGETTKLLNLKI